MKRRSLFPFSVLLLLAALPCQVAAGRAAERAAGHFAANRVAGYSAEDFADRAAGVSAAEPFDAAHVAERSGGHFAADRVAGYSAEDFADRAAGVSAAEPFAVARAAEYPVEHLAVARAAEYPVEHLAVARAADFPAGRTAELLAAEYPAEYAAEHTVAVRTADPAPDRAAELLAGLSGGFRAMNGYAVAFSVAADELLTRGRYAVEGEGYYLTLGDAEVFGDEVLRYEVDNRRREITVDRVDASSRNILSNPVHAFDFLDSAYGSELLWERDGRAAVALTPVAESGTAIGRITVTVSTASMRPLALTYDYDGERIDVTVERIDPLDGPLRRFDRADYAGYEFIDFR